MEKRPPFPQLLGARWAENKFLCVGLDSEPSLIPASVAKNVINPSTRFYVEHFNISIVKATSDYVCAFKINAAFYEEQGTDGICALLETIRFINEFAPGVAVILDIKRGDIGNTNLAYARSAYEKLGADAATVNPILGGKALQPFLQYRDKGVIVLCRTSNEGAQEFWDLPVAGGDPLYLHVARQFSREHNTNGNVALVVGATAPKQLAEVRSVVGRMPILIPGIGAQGGDLEASVLAGRDDRKQGIIINASRSIIFASKGEDYAQRAGEEARKLHEAIAKIIAS